MNNSSFFCWKGVAASVPGSGHIRRDIPCQDASLITLSGRPSVIVCDGRGSAALSHFGAQAAVKMFRTQIAVFEPMLAALLDVNEPNEEAWHNFSRIMYRTLMQVKLDLAATHNQQEKEFDFTVAFAITGERSIGCFQVGDGAIVLRQNGELQTAFLPEKGEFANQTHFLRAGGENKGKFQAKLFPAQDNSGIAVTSDGPEHLMFKLPEMLPGKVFDAMFNDLAVNEITRQDILNYLTDRNWDLDPRGSDDRSIALLVPASDAGEKLETDTPTAEPETEASAAEADIPSAEPETEASAAEEAVQLSKAVPFVGLRLFNFTVLITGIVIIYSLAAAVCYGAVTNESLQQELTRKQEMITLLQKKTMKTTGNIK